MYDSNMQQPPAAAAGGGGQPAPNAYPPNMNNNHLNPSSSYGPNYNASGQWTTGLCDCCDNKSNCCITCFCPCVTFGQIAEIVDRGSSSCGTSGALYALILGISGMQWIYSCFYRTKLRAQYGLPKRPCNDCLVHWCCEPCAVCQEYRELKNRGFDMRIGWEENVQRQGMGTVSAPPVIQAGMSR